MITREDVESLCTLTVGAWDMDTLVEYAAECMAQRVIAAIERSPCPDNAHIVLQQFADGDTAFYDGPYNCKKDAELVAAEMQDAYGKDSRFYTTGVKL